MAGLEKASPNQVLATEVQKLLSDPKHRIQLHNLVHKETEAVYKTIEAFSTQTTDLAGAAKKAISEFETVTKNLRMIVAYGSYFGIKEQAYLWTGVLNRLGTMPHPEGSTFLIKLQLYPALLVLYAGGIPALAAKNGESLRALLSAQSKDRTREDRELILDANCTMLGDSGNQLFDLERRKTPLSDHLNELFTKTLPKELTFGQDFDQLFDNWEILVGMVVADILKDRSVIGPWAPVGRFAWREQYSGLSTLKALKKELDESKPGWFPLKVGLFGGSELRAREALSVVDKIADRVSFF